MCADANLRSAIISQVRQSHTRTETIAASGGETLTVRPPAGGAVADVAGVDHGADLTAIEVEELRASVRTGCPRRVTT